MSKFVVKKRFDLGFVSEEWKEKGAYLELNAFTVGDIRDRLSKLTQINKDDSSDVSAGLAQMVSLLEEKFVAGKAVDSAGTLVDLTKEDIQELPAEVIAKAVSFLSQGMSQN